MNIYEYLYKKYAFGKILYTAELLIVFFTIGNGHCF